jgi:predicted nucleic acid-binding protein
MKNVLIDTSGWIDFFCNKTGRIGDVISALLENDRAYLTGVIQAELLHGVRGKKEAGQLSVLFNTVPCLIGAEDDWLATGRLLHRLKSKGITVPLTDALIAVIAKRDTMNVLTLDKHFKYLPVNNVIE